MNGLARPIEVTLAQPGERLDRALAAAEPSLSRAQWQRLIYKGLVTLDGRPIKPSRRVLGGEVVQALLPEVVEKTELAVERIPLDIVYEDGDLLVINKPAGMVVHPAVGHSQGTLVNAILGYCPDLPGIDGEKRPGIVHRLDKETSGLIVIAKHDLAMRHLQAQFKQRTVGKKYLALVEGQIQPPRALIDAPIGRGPHQRQKMIVLADRSAAARSAQTTYEAIHYYRDYSLVACYPRTGRTHQIRVHLAYVGYPIVGDQMYGRQKQRLSLSRHFLHAAELTFRRPSDEQELTFTAALPSELQAVLDDLAQRET
ncbi:MAG: RluA family pseudouridine synthase [Chloroflexota bacterium]